MKQLINHGTVRAKEGTKRRAQESVGFMITIGIALMLFVIFSGIIISNSDSALRIQELTKTRNINEKISRAVYRSFMNGPGSSEVISLEQTQENYTVLITSGNTIITNELGSNTNPTYANKVYPSNVTHGQVLIKNQEGWINVTQI